MQILNKYLQNIWTAINEQIKHGIAGALTFIDVDSVSGFKALEAAQSKKTSKS